jgi:hypothetical protein
VTAYEKVSLAIQSVGIIAIVATLIVYIRIHHTMVAQLNAALNASTEQLNKLQLEILQRSKERDAYVGLIDSILDLKRWAVDQRILMDGIREHDVFKQLVQSEVIGDEKELMAMCILFFRLERLYRLNRSASITPEERRGLNQEEETWLGLSPVRTFFFGYCLKAQCYSQDFLENVKRHYNEGHKFGE